jgi:hypothetical protein
MSSLVLLKLALVLWIRQPLIFWEFWTHTGFRTLKTLRANPASMWSTPKLAANATAEGMISNNFCLIVYIANYLQGLSNTRQWLIFVLLLKS